MFHLETFKCYGKVIFLNIQRAHKMKKSDVIECIQDLTERMDTLEQENTCLREMVQITNKALLRESARLHILLTVLWNTAAHASENYKEVFRAMLTTHYNKLHMFSRSPYLVKAIDKRIGLDEFLNAIKDDVHFHVAAFEGMEDVHDKP